MLPNDKIDTYFYITGWVCIMLLAVAAIVINVTGTNVLKSMPPCAFNEVTHLYCPGCGGTRSLFALFRGDIIHSFFYHPFNLYAFIICGWFMVSQTVQRVSRNRLKIGMHFRPIYLWLALVIILVNWIVKNLFILIGGIYLLH